MRHRSAVAADGLSGDGAGILLPIPQLFFARTAREAGLSVPVGRAPRRRDRLFDATDTDARRTAEQAVTEACATEGLALLGWRPIPTDDTLLGAAAQRSAPYFAQAILAPAARPTAAPRPRAALPPGPATGGDRLPGGGRAALLRQLVVRHRRLQGAGHERRPVGLLSRPHRSGLRSAAGGVPLPLLDQHHTGLERAQPFRYLCHNGEINTLRGNEHRMAARGRLVPSTGLGPEDLFSPLLDRRTPTPASSTAPSSCSSTAAVTSAMPWPCSSPRRGKAAATCPARSATSSATTPAWPSRGTARRA